MTVTVDMAISLDGYVAGTDVTLDNPGGDGAEPLFEWIHELASWRERQGMTGGLENRDSALMREWFDATGAVVMGRTMYDTGGTSGATTRRSAPRSSCSPTGPARPW
jgi:dihydrofolate reductase